MSSQTDDRPKILCVDDEESVLDSLRRLLREHFDVHTAVDGEEGLRLVEACDPNEFAIILSDYRMPGLSGTDFLKRARQHSPCTVRAILSGQMDMTALSEAINNAEIHRFIMKPWENEYLKIQMLEALQTHVALSEKQHYQVLSITDPITGLTNHRYFQETLRKEMKLAKQEGHPLSLVMIDVDHFKSFNDHYGHPEGDRLLASISQHIANFNQGRGTASRYGGEEFSLIYPGVDLQEAAELADELRSSLERNAFSGPFGRRAYITVSVGVASYPHHSTDPAQLVVIADRALYRAKRQGRNQTVIAK